MPVYVLWGTVVNKISKNYVCRLVPESVRWLASKGKFDQARRILGKMARFNKVSLPDTLLEDNLSYDEVFVHERPEGAVTIGEQDSVNGDEEENNRKYSVLDLFRTPKIRKRTLVLTYCWLVGQILNILFTSNKIEAAP